MARIHRYVHPTLQGVHADQNRDGQKRPVYIYRLLTACTIDEKIYQVSNSAIEWEDGLTCVATNHKDGTVGSDAGKGDVGEKFQLLVHKDG